MHSPLLYTRLFFSSVVADGDPEAVAHVLQLLLGCAIKACLQYTNAYICMYMYVCKQMHIYVCICMYVYKCIYMYVYVCMYWYIYIYIYTCISLLKTNRFHLVPDKVNKGCNTIHTYIHTYIYVCIVMYVFVYKCRSMGNRRINYRNMHVCLCIYIFIHTNIYLHIYMQKHLSHIPLVIVLIHTRTGTPERDICGQHALPPPRVPCSVEGGHPRDPHLGRSRHLTHWYFLCLTHACSHTDAHVHTYSC